MPDRKFAALLCGTLAIIGCTEGERTTDRAAEAARADSSAAGYAVGVAAQDTTPAPVRRDTPLAVAAAAVPAKRPTAAITAAKRPAGEKRDSARAATGPDADSTRTHADSLPVARTPLPVGVARVNEFLSYDAQTRTATLLLVAGYNGMNDALNYNGGARGSQGVSVPLGWNVHVAITNRDSDLQHSAIVMRQILPPPEEMTTPAFAGSIGPRLEEGVHEGDTASFDFVANKPGRYMLACGVPGHAQGGMWMRFTVSTEIDRPAYR